MKYITTTLFACFVIFATATDILSQEPTFANVPYVKDGGERQQLDIYLPKNYQEEEKLPVLVWIHGGGWTTGDKKDMPGKFFINRGYACISVNYRLSQQAVFPAQIEDCKGAIRWLRANAQTYHLDPDRIGVWGASAGGHLSALLGVTNNKKEFDVGENLEHSSTVQAVCDIFGPTDFTAIFAADAFSVITSLLGGPVSEKRELAVKASPITHITKEAPPYLILHGSEDRLVPVTQSTRFYDMLKKADVDAEIVVVKGAGHDVGVFMTLESLRKTMAFFDKNVKNAKAR